MKALRLLTFPALALILIASAFSVSAHADVIGWNVWSATGSTPGNPGTATGAIAGGPTVTYSGQFNSIVTGYPTWTPTSTYTGGAVGNGPVPTDNIIQMTGGTSLAESITFSSPVVNPVMAIWSLGAGGTLASYDFTASEPFTVVAGGPSAEYGGSSIYACGSFSVCGSEGNGVLQFTGTYTTIDFTTPGYENWYGFTVGDDATLTGAGPSPIPEPETLSLLGLGLMALPVLRSKFARRSRA
jgi:hypothetical protein